MLAVRHQTREYPILFTGSLVRAIKEGKKTQTRRLVSMRGIEFVGAQGRNGPDWNDPSCWGFEHHDAGWFLLKPEAGEHQIRCPYGWPGDRLWVREAFNLMRFSHDWETGYIDDWDIWADRFPASRDDVPRGWHLQYRADWLAGDDEGTKWRPSIHMPRWASRLSLRVTDTRVERLQCITEEEAVAEGCTGYAEPNEIGGQCVHTPADEFEELWDEINGDRAPWSSNPWVWVIEFEREQFKRTEGKEG